MQVQLTQRQVEELRRLAAERKVSIAQCVREGVDELIHSANGPDRRAIRERAIRAAGRFSSGLTDLAERHDDYFAEACEH